MGEAGHLRSKFRVVGHQRFVIGREGYNSRSELIQHRLVVGGGCRKVVEVVFKVVLAEKFVNGTPIWGRGGRGGGGVGLPQRPMGSCILFRGQTMDAFLHVGGLVGRISRVLGLHGLVKVLQPISGVWEGSRLQHYVRCN